MDQMTEPTGGGTVQPAGTTGAESGSAGERASATASAAKEGALNVAGEAKQQAGQLASEAFGQARGVLDQALGQAREQGDQQATRAAGGLRSLSDQLRALSEGRTEEAGNVSQFAGRIGEQAQSLADRLDSGGLRGVADDVADFARRRPAVFLAGAAALGFVAGRALRANRVDTGDDDSTLYRRQGVYGSDLGYPSGPSDVSVGRIPGDTYATPAVGTSAVDTPTLGTTATGAGATLPPPEAIDPLVGNPNPGVG